MREFVVELPKFVPDHLCNTIVNLSKNNLETSKLNSFATIGYSREGITYRIPKDDPLDSLILNNIIYKILHELNNYPYYSMMISGLDNKINDSGYDYHRYFTNDKCKLHADGIVLKTPNCFNFFDITFAAISINLNTPKSGGELILPEINVKIKPEKGKVVIFPTHPYFTHEVLPCDKGHRDVLITWLSMYEYIAVKRDDYENQNS